MVRMGEQARVTVGDERLGECSVFSVASSVCRFGFQRADVENCSQGLGERGCAAMEPYWKSEENELRDRWSELRGG